MEDDINERLPQWRKTSMKTTSIEDNFNGMEDDSMEHNLIGRRPQWKMTSMEDNHNR